MWFNVVGLKLLFSVAGSTEAHQYDVDQCGE